MTNIPRSTESAEHLREQAIAALVPFFVDGLTSDEAAARAVAEGIVDDYKAATPKELQLSTQIIAFGWASLACLSAAIVARDRSLEQMLRLQDAALALDRSTQKATKALEARRKERAKNPRAMYPESTQWDEGAFQLAIHQAMERMNEANAKLTAFLAASPVEQQLKLSSQGGEPMTQAILARRRRH
jgi:hypothetical protein